MPKDRFFDQLEVAVRNTTIEALEGTGWSADHCPYINYWLEYYRGRDSRALERAIHRYAPATVRVTAAADYIPLVTERVRRAVEVWSATGRITEVPAGIPIRIPGSDPDQLRRATSNGVSFKLRDGAEKPATDPLAIQSDLGPGSSLDGRVQARMGAAFGADFSDVRVHTDARAGALTNRLNARALTVGQHVAFGTGEYRPGTLVGDALIAHELAHVLQQEEARGPAAGGGETRDAEYGALEHDADRSAMHAVTALWTGGRGTLGTMGRQARASLRSGLKLQRCDKTPTPTPTSPTVDQITIVDSPTGAIGGYPAIMGKSDLNVPGPFNDATTGEVKNVHQIHFHLDAGDSAGLTPTRVVTAKMTGAGTSLLDVTDQNDGPAAHETRRPSTDKIVVADSPGPRALAAANYPFIATADFVLTVAAGGTDVARIKYGVRINKASATDIPNTENRIFSTEKKDLVRNKDLA